MMAVARGMRRFGMNRIQIREEASKGNIPGHKRVVGKERRTNVTTINDPIADLDPAFVTLC